MNVDLTQYHNWQKEILKAQYPGCKIGRCIVTSAFDREMASAWVSLSELARFGVTLPILIYSKENELSDANKIRLQSLPLDLSFHTVSDSNIHGYAVKSYAITECEYEEVLWLDTDMFMLRNPEFLFDDSEYVQKGSLFWRDVCGADRAKYWHPAAPVWQVFDVPYNEAEEFESGIFLVNKSKCWNELLLTRFFCQNHQLYFQVVHGDKDCFRLAWQYVHHKRAPQTFVGGSYMTFNCAYGFMPYGPFHVGRPNPWRRWGGGSVMVQRDRDGEPLCNHRNLNKYKFEDANDTVNDTPQDEIYRDHLRKF